MPWTTLQTVLVVPAIYGAIGAILRATGKTQAATDWWTRKFNEWGPRGVFVRTMHTISAVYLVLGSLNLALDVSQWPAWLYEKKIQKDAKIDYKKMLPKLAYTLLVNVFAGSALSLLAKLVAPDTGAAMEQALAEKVASYVRFTAEVPSMWEMTRDTAAFMAVYDVLFFYSHWALHTKWLYANIHVKHHEWRSPTGLAAGYAHPLEYMTSNFAPLIVGSVLLRPHILSVNAFTTLAVVITVTDHCGYELIDTGAFHNLHHFYVTKNFGLTGAWDELHGTRMRPYSSRPIRGAREREDSTSEDS